MSITVNIRIQGGQKLNGVIKPSGSKNSAVSIIPSTLMFDTPVTLMNVPEITDVNKLIAIMQKLGSKIDWQKKEGVMTEKFLSKKLRVKIGMQCVEHHFYGVQCLRDLGKLILGDYLEVVLLALGRFRHTIKLLRIWEWKSKRGKME